jgi:hypothetical protein
MIEYCDIFVPYYGGTKMVTATRNFATSVAVDFNPDPYRTHKAIRPPQIE